MKVESIGLVKQSAIMIAVEIHLHSVESLDCCLINMTSIVVLHSWQFGVAILFTKSYRLLQSVTSKAFGSAFKDSSGFCHRKRLSFIIAHMHLNQVNLSSDDDIAYASALKVDRTTLLICFECHAIGDMSEILFSLSSLVHAAMKTPCCALSWDSEAKLASPKLANVTFPIGMGVL